MATEGNWWQERLGRSAENREMAPQSPANSRLVDAALYVRGKRTPLTAATVAEVVEKTAGTPDAIGWVAFEMPRLAEINELADALNMHPMLVEDIITSHQRPKLERYQDTLFTVMRLAEYSDAAEEVFFDEIHVIVSRNIVVCIHQKGEIPIVETGWLTEILRRFESRKNLIKLGPEAMLYAIIDQVTDGYYPVLSGLVVDTDQVERQVFSGDAAAPQRIYRLSREVIDFQRAVAPLTNVVSNLESGFEKYSVEQGLRAYLTDVTDHLIRISEETAEIRELLTRILTVNSTLVAQHQSEDMKKISAWAAIFALPTVIASIYGMNFDHMPELHWPYGYLFALGLMVASSVCLYILFKRRDWL